MRGGGGKRKRERERTYSYISAELKCIYMYIRSAEAKNNTCLTSWKRIPIKAHLPGSRGWCWVWPHVRWSRS